MANPIPDEPSTQPPPVREPQTLGPPASGPSAKPDSPRSVQPTLEKLFELYPHLFGSEFLPLKRGIFQELLAKHPQNFERATLKAALGVHTRSTRYLKSVAAGKQRYDLQGLAVEPVAAEHVGLAILELFRRRQAHSSEDLRPKALAQLSAAFAASGLTRQEYLARLQTKDAPTTALLEESLADHGQQLARREALRLAFASSGKTVNEFAAMYGLSQRDVNAALVAPPTD